MNPVPQQHGNSKLPQEWKNATDSRTWVYKSCSYLVFSICNTALKQHRTVGLWFCLPQISTAPFGGCTGPYAYANTSACIRGMERVPTWELSWIRCLRGCLRNNCMRMRKSAFPDYDACANLPTQLCLRNKNINCFRECLCVGDSKMMLTWCRAAKFTKNKNDQWNHAGGFSISICAGLSLKMQPRNNWLNCRVRCMGFEPPKCRRLHASGILRVRTWKG